MFLDVGEHVVDRASVEFEFGLANTSRYSVSIRLSITAPISPARTRFRARAGAPKGDISAEIKMFVSRTTLIVCVRGARPEFRLRSLRRSCDPARAARPACAAEKPQVAHAAPNGLHQLFHILTFGREHQRKRPPARSHDRSPWSSSCCQTSPGRVRMSRIETNSMSVLRSQFGLQLVCGPCRGMSTNPPCLSLRFSAPLRLCVGAVPPNILTNFIIIDTPSSPCYTPAHV